MNILVFSDFLLAAAGFVLVFVLLRLHPLRLSVRWTVGLSVSLISLAASLGMFRYSGMYVLAEWHMWFSQLGATVAIPLAMAGIAINRGDTGRRLNNAWGKYLPALLILLVLGVGLMGQRLVSGIASAGFLIIAVSLNYRSVWAIVAMTLCLAVLGWLRGFEAMVLEQRLIVMHLGLVWLFLLLWIEIRFCARRIQSAAGVVE